jgi:hypothetical protein
MNPTDNLNLQFELATEIDNAFNAGWNPNTEDVKALVSLVLDLNTYIAELGFQPRLPAGEATKHSSTSLGVSYK